MMDPDTAWSIMCDPGAALDERADASAALVEWIANGGFLPTRMDARAAVASAAAILAEAWSSR